MDWYDTFKAIYCGVLAFTVVGVLGAITAVNPYITLGLLGAFLVIGGAYIAHKQGWLDGDFP